MKHNRDGRPDRQTARHQHLRMFLGKLQVRGYGTRWDVHRLGAKEVRRVVHDWREEEIAESTIANRLVAVRWLAEKLGRADLIPTNRELGILGRNKAPGWGENKAKPLDPQALDRLGERELLITQIRHAFGLRTEEACKFSHAYATADDPEQIRLKGSWCKGGRPRTIPVADPWQRELLDRVGEFQRRHGERSMIPKDVKFVTYYRRYNRFRNALDIAGHGLRHGYAQRIFEQVAGFPAPLAGGPAYSGLDAEARERWDRAAAIVNQELGHGRGRQDITAAYIGRRT